MNPRRFQNGAGHGADWRACRSASSRRRRAGFLLLDVLTGMAMAVVLVGVLAVACGEYRRGSMTLADQRAAQRMAERVMLQLRTRQAHGPGTGADAGADMGVVRVQRLRDASSVKGQVWVEVRVAYRQQQAVLIGLVPAAPEEAKP